MANGSLIAPFWITWRFFFNIFMIMSCKNPASRTTGQWMSLCVMMRRHRRYFILTTIHSMHFFFIDLVLWWHTISSLVLIEMVQNHLERVSFFLQECHCHLSELDLNLVSPAAPHDWRQKQSNMTMTERLRKCKEPVGNKFRVKFKLAGKKRV